MSRNGDFRQYVFISGGLKLQLQHLDCFGMFGHLAEDRCIYHTVCVGIYQRASTTSEANSTMCVFLERGDRNTIRVEDLFQRLELCAQDFNFCEELIVVNVVVSNQRIDSLQLIKSHLRFLSLQVWKETCVRKRNTWSRVEDEKSESWEEAKTNIEKKKNSINEG